MKVQELSLAVASAESLLLICVIANTALLAPCQYQERSQRSQSGLSHSVLCRASSVLTAKPRKVVVPSDIDGRVVREVKSLARNRFTRKDREFGRCVGPRVDSDLFLLWQSVAWFSSALKSGRRFSSVFTQPNPLLPKSYGWAARWRQLARLEKYLPACNRLATTSWGATFVRPELN